MNRRTSITLIATLLSSAVFLSTEAFAQQGTAQEAQAMLTKAVAAVKADKTKAIDSSKGKADFWSATSIHSASKPATAKSLPLKQSN